MAEKRLLEKEIKEYLLDSEKLFGELGKSTVLFEKKLLASKQTKAKVTIADCLVFSEKRGVLGIEIKTEFDSTQRLNNQLRSYSVVCDFVYVMCHDKHVPKVEKIMKDHGHAHVGIIAYTQFRGEPLAGVYKEATKSPTKNVYHTLNILWKDEILKLLGTFRHPGPRIQNELGLSAQVVKDRNGGIGGLDVKSAYNKKMRKNMLIKEFIGRVGPIEANKILCSIFYEHRRNIEHAIKLKHFNPSTLKREE